MNNHTGGDASRTCVRSNHFRGGGLILLGREHIVPAGGADAADKQLPLIRGEVGERILRVLAVLPSAVVLAMNLNGVSLAAEGATSFDSVHFSYLLVLSDTIIAHVPPFVKTNFSNYQ